MATQKGFEYEENAYNALAKYGISTGGVAGASHDKPDLTVKSGRTTAGVELKNSPTAAGSLVLKYVDGNWDYGDTGGNPEKEFLKAIGERYNLMQEMNKRGTYGQKWRGKVPHLQNDSRGKKIVVAAKDKADAYKKDIEQFGGINEVQIPVPAKAVSDYYNSKKCDYINVGTHGFFLLNSGDSLKLNAKMRKLNHATIPDFGRSATCKIRVRCQLKSSSTSDYQFVMTLQFSGVKKSPYNLAPLKTGSKSEIDEKALGKETLLEAF